jgi:hypothetical protein
MNNFNEQLHNQAQNIRLSVAEKDALRTRLYAAMGERAAPPQRPSPYFFYNFQFVGVARYALAAFLMVAFVGGGTVSAARGALPGDLLYPVKISVNEVVEQSLALDIASKAAVHAKLAQRRVEEVESLVARGDLREEVVVQVEESFDQHIKSAGSFSAQLEAEDPGAAAELALTLESSLAAHGEILASLGEESEDEDVRERSSRFSSRVLAQAGGSFNSRTALSLRTSDSAASSEAATMALKVVAEGDSAKESTALQAPAPAGADTPARDAKTALYLQARASTTLKEVEDKFIKDKESFGRGGARIEAQLEALADQMSVGAEALKAGAYVQAEETFGEVLRSAVALKAYLDAQRRFDRDFSSRYFGGDKGWFTVGEDFEGEVRGTQDKNTRDEDIGDDKGANDATDDSDSTDNDAEYDDRGDDEVLDINSRLDTNINIKIRP